MATSTFTQLLNSDSLNIIIIIIDTVCIYKTILWCTQTHCTLQHSSFSAFSQKGEKLIVTIYVQESNTYINKYIYDN